MDVTLDGLTMEDELFETALDDPVGAGFRANVQDLVVRGIIIVELDGTPLTAIQIRDFTA
jgi:hypothetical protein